MNNNIKKIEKDICSICLEELISNIAVLDCDHKYHFDCIQLWYNKKRESGSFLNCPLCNNEYAEIVNVKYAYNRNLVTCVKTVTQFSNNIVVHPSTHIRPIVQHNVSNYHQVIEEHVQVYPQIQQSQRTDTQLLSSSESTSSIIDTICCTIL